MSYDSAIKALSNDALKFVKDNYIIGLGSGRAATTLVKSLALLIKEKKYNITGVPTSLQIKLIAQENNIPIVESDQISHIDLVFDGADQIDSQNFVIKGGGGALLRENILFSLAKKIIVMADKTKFVKNFTRTVPVEVHPLARNSVTNTVQKSVAKFETKPDITKEVEKITGSSRLSSTKNYGGYDASYLDK